MSVIAPAISENTKSRSRSRTFRGFFLYLTWGMTCSWEWRCGRDPRQCRDGTPRQWVAGRRMGPTHELVTSQKCSAMSRKKFPAGGTQLWGFAVTFLHHQPFSAQGAPQGISSFGSFSFVFASSRSVSDPLNLWNLLREQNPTIGRAGSRCK